MLTVGLRRVLGALSVLALAAILVQTADAAKPRYRVQGATILDTRGKPFVVRGVMVADGVLTDATVPVDGAKVARALRDIRRLSKLGVNLVRIPVIAADADPARYAQLRRLIIQARKRHLVVLLAIENSTIAETTPWLSDLAHRWGADPGVWIQPAVDPACDGPLADRARCQSWATWKAEQRGLVATLRAGGMRSPVVLSTPRRSRDLRLVRSYRLGDRNVIYGVHRSGGPRKSFTPGEADAIAGAWGGRISRRFAVIVDELARTSKGKADHAAWTTGFAAYIADWVSERGGDGAIASSWQAGGRDALMRANGSLTSWGETFRDRYLGLLAGRASLTEGDHGADVRLLQRDLAAHTYLDPADISGAYGYATLQAVMALQGHQGFERTGSATLVNRVRLAADAAPKPVFGGGAHAEVSLERQTLLLVRADGSVERTIHVSSGASGKTPRGHFQILSKYLSSYSRPFKVNLLWASYFFGGYAFHEYPYVPGYPASHGCVRVPASESKRVFAYVQYGMPVYVA